MSNSNGQLTEVLVKFGMVVFCEQNALAARLKVAGAGA